ncbi:DUF4830 domain-containing protein [Bacillaceae bacterium S4-13-56]
MKKIVLFVSLFLLVGCNTTSIQKEHEEYLTSFGWHIQKFTKKETITIDYLPEALESIKIAGLDLGPYKDQEATVTSYFLKEKQKSGDKMTFHIYEIDGKIIGGYGTLENWSPGLFALDDRDVLIERNVMKKEGE